MPDRLALEIALWEFRRFFRWKDQLVGLLLLVLGWGGVSVAGLVVGKSGRPVRIAVHGAPELALEPQAGSRLRIQPALARTAAELRAAVRTGDLEGAVLFLGPGRAELVVPREPRWKGELEKLLLDARREAALARLSAADATSRALLSPLELKVIPAQPGKAGRGRAEAIAAAVFVGMMILGVFLALGWLMSGVTGEKQLRVTELVLSAVPAQTWIDGKILGITALVLVSLLTTSAGILALAAVVATVSGSALPVAVVSPGFLLAAALFTLLGLLLWTAFFAAVSATIDDPNTSTKGGLLFLPLLPVVLTFAVVKDPDSVLSRVLSLLPPTSASALPARLVLADVPAWEPVLAGLLLLGAALVARRAAGRVFRLGMLMTGKEPTVPEILRWMREG